MRQRILILLAGSIACAISMMWIDVPLAHWIHDHQTPWMLTLGGWLEEAGKSHWILLVAAVVAAFAWGRDRDVARRHLALFTAVATSGIAANIVKIFVSRSRPPLLIDQSISSAAPFTFSMDYLWQSFPSGHSTTGLAIAVAGSFAWPRMRWLAWGLGLSIAAGRLLYNVHYLSDVIAGSMLGILFSWLAIAFWCPSDDRKMRDN